MQIIHLLLEDLEQARDYTLGVLDHVADEDWYRAPAPGINPVAWHVGHLAIVEYHLCLKRVRGVRDSDHDLLPLEEYSKKFGKGSIPSANPTDYPTQEELRRVLENVHEQTLAEIREMDESVLAESCGAPHPMFTTKGGAIRFCPKHEMLHTGQISLLRRLFGGRVLR